MKLLRTAGGVAMVAALCLGVAHAQVNPFGRGVNGQRLSPQDTQMLSQAAADLNRDPAAAAGSLRQWQNPQSGASGTVTLQRVFQTGDMPCHALEYKISTSVDKASRTYNVSWCKTAADEWKIVN